MKCLKGPLSVFFLSMFLMLAQLQVFAASAAELQDQASQALVKLDIMQKEKKGGLRLKDKTKRYEFITFVNAAMSYNVEEDSAKADIEFKDLTPKHAAYSQFRAAAANGLVTAYEDGTIRPDKAITIGDSLTILLKALGYRDELSGMAPSDILKTAAELGITGETAPKYDDPLTRGNAAIYLFHFISIDFNKQPTE